MKTVTVTDFVSFNTMINYYFFYDLSMVCNINGDVVAANAVDKSGKASLQQKKGVDNPSIEFDAVA